MSFNIANSRNRLLAFTARSKSLSAKVEGGAGGNDLDLRPFQLANEKEGESQQKKRNVPASKLAEGFFFRCRHCSETSVEQAKMFEHVRDFHRRDARFNEVVRAEMVYPRDTYMFKAKCNICKSSFLGERARVAEQTAEHAKQEHNRRPWDIFEYRCRCCQALSFQSLADLADHVAYGKHNMSRLELDQVLRMKRARFSEGRFSRREAFRQAKRESSESLDEEEHVGARHVKTERPLSLAKKARQEEVRVIGGQMEEQGIRCWYCRASVAASVRQGHLTAHIEDAFRCLLCKDRAFDFVDQIVEHMERHHNYRAKAEDIAANSTVTALPADCRECVCGVCNLTLLAQDEHKVRLHVAEAHAAEASCGRVSIFYRCRICRLYFSSCSDLTVHCWGTKGVPYCVNQPQPAKSPPSADSEGKAPPSAYLQAIGAFVLGEIKKSASQHDELRP